MLLKGRYLKLFLWVVFVLLSVVFSVQSDDIPVIDQMILFSVDSSDTFSTVTFIIDTTNATGWYLGVIGRESKDQDVLEWLYLPNIQIGNPDHTSTFLQTDSRPSFIAIHQKQIVENTYRVTLSTNDFPSAITQIQLVLLPQIFPEEERTADSLCQLFGMCQEGREFRSQWIDRSDNQKTEWQYDPSLHPEDVVDAQESTPLPEAEAINEVEGEIEEITPESTDEPEDEVEEPLPDPSIIETFLANGFFRLPDGGEDLFHPIHLEANRDYIVNMDDSEPVVEGFMYYSISVSAGELLQIKAITPNCNPTDTLVNCGITYMDVYDQERVLLKSLSVDTPSKRGSLVWRANSSKETYTFHLGINALQGTTVYINTTSQFDAGSDQDAGDSFGMALNLDADIYKGFVGNCSWLDFCDTQDFYQLLLEEGQTVRVTIIPTGDQFNSSYSTMYTLSIFDSLRNQQVATNPGSTVNTLEYRSDSTQVVYIAIGTIDTYNLPYIMEVLIL